MVRRYEEERWDLVVLSLGAGVQSSTLLLFLELGLVRPRPDCAIFADTGWEPADVYSHLDWLERQVTIPIHRVGIGNIRDAVLGGFSHSTRRKGQNVTVMPVFSGAGQMSVRQCTRDYKLTPINQKVRELLGYKPGERIRKGVSVLQYIGISEDEHTRKKDSGRKYIEHRFPLADELHYTRSDCKMWFEQRYPGRTLPRSACIGCPLHNGAEWWEMRKNRPEEFADAVEVDEALRRDGPRMKPRNETEDGLQYIHYSGKPLSEAITKPKYNDGGTLGLFSVDAMQNECEGMCGV